MTEIPNDIMQAAKAVVTGIKCFPPSDLDALLLSVARAILTERQRHAEVMEELRKVLEPFANECARWPDDKAPDDYVIKVKLYSKVMPSKLCVGDLRSVRSLLSRLEER